MTGFAAVSSMRRVNQTVDFSAVSAGAKQAAQKELILLKNNETEAILHTIKEEGWLTTAILFLTYILTYIRSIRSRSAGGTGSIMCAMGSIPLRCGRCFRFPGYAGLVHSV